MIPILLISKSTRKSKTFINEFVKKNNFSPVSIYTYQKEDTVLTIDQTREVSKLFVRHDPTQKLIVIYDFDTAKEPTQNTMLKTIEEKSEFAQFIIVASDEMSVLPTIASRCQIIKLKPDVKKEVEIVLDKPIAELFANYSFVDKKKGKAIEVCDTLLTNFQKQILESVDSPSKLKKLPMIIKEILKVRTLIEKNNLGPLIAIDHLIMFVKKNYHTDAS